MVILMTKEEWLECPENERECEFCSYITNGCDQYDEGFPEKEPYMLCEICSSTLLSKVLWYPEQYPSGSNALYSSIAWIANRILDEIRANTQELPVP